MLGMHLVSEDDYKRMPYLLPHYKEYGFDGTDLLSYFMQTDNYCFPKIYPKFEDFIEFVDFPITDSLRHNVTYSIRLKKKKGCNVALINEKDFFKDDTTSTLWRQEEGVWVIDFTPKKRGDLFVAIRDPHDKTLYHSVLEYKTLQKE